MDEKLEEQKKKENTILTIDKNKHYSQKNDEFYSTLKLLKNSMSEQKFVSGRVSGVEMIKTKRKNEMGEEQIVLVPTACVDIGSFRVLIPFHKFMDEKPIEENGRFQSQEEYNYYLLTKRLDSEIDFIVSKINEDKNIAIGNRKKAMIRKKSLFWFRKNKNNEEIIDINKTIESRIVCTRRSGIYVEVFGCESFIPNRDLKWHIFNDATNEFYVGDRLNVLVKNVERNDENGEVILELSAKEAQDTVNPYEKAFNRYKVGSIFTGIVARKTNKGIFVTICPYSPMAVTVLCKNNDRLNATGVINQSNVTVRITNKDENTRMIFGTIINKGRINNY